MKIVVFGASGRTGSLFMEQALEKGHQVIAYVRNPASIKQQHPNLKIVNGQLSDTSKLSEVISGADACISTLGGNSLTKHSGDFMAGIENIIKVMEQTGVKRFIYLSSIGVGESRYFMGAFMRFLIIDLFLRVPMADHNVNEKQIISSNLSWTIVRPGSLTDGPLVESLKFGSDKLKITGNPKISRASVASFMLSQLADNKFAKKAVWLWE